MSTTRYILPIMDGINPSNLQAGENLVQITETAEGNNFWGVCSVMLLGGVSFIFISYEVITFIKNCDCFRKSTTEQPVVLNVSKQKNLLRTLVFGLLLVFTCLAYMLILYFMG
ncbi:hypothetical protein SAMN05216474_1660 [Lishizhenia tianjinensis]|uniref:Uncharacterized protein n=1 Tax=Lishizhenia tianjinensis TaxID=477690 RepID=A0A1I6ZVX9_9FLAO|nr:hypothetical protein [Lishizhenia tianjinensis]SFT66821.1 hypothetical protein SAMN05216474_1660 [Lishizhenia tianjinensis]